MILSELSVDEAFAYARKIPEPDLFIDTNNKVYIALHGVRNVHEYALKELFGLGQPEYHVLSDDLGISFHDILTAYITIHWSKIKDMFDVTYEHSNVLDDIRYNIKCPKWFNGTGIYYTYPTKNTPGEHFEREFKKTIDTDNK